MWKTLVESDFLERKRKINYEPIYEVLRRFYGREEWKRFLASICVRLLEPLSFSGVSSLRRANLLDDCHKLLWISCGYPRGMKAKESLISKHVADVGIICMVSTWIHLRRHRKNYWANGRFNITVRLVLAGFGRARYYPNHVLMVLWAQIKQHTGLIFCRRASNESEFRRGG